jgi:hypothetical protein
MAGHDSEFLFKCDECISLHAHQVHSGLHLIERNASGGVGFTLALGDTLNLDVSEAEWLTGPIGDANLEGPRLTCRGRAAAVWGRREKEKQ